MKTLQQLAEQLLFRQGKVERAWFDGWTLREGKTWSDVAAAINRAVRTSYPSTEFEEQAIVSTLRAHLKQSSDNSRSIEAKKEENNGIIQMKLEV